MMVFAVSGSASMWAWVWMSRTSGFMDGRCHFFNPHTRFLLPYPKLSEIRPTVSNLPTYENRPEPNTRRPVLSYGEEIDPSMALRNCAIGKSFVVDREWDRNRLFNVARQLGMKIRTHKEVI